MCSDNRADIINKQCHKATKISKHILSRSTPLRVARSFKILRSLPPGFFAPVRCHDLRRKFCSAVILTSVKPTLRTESPHWHIRQMLVYQRKYLWAANRAAEPRILPPRPAFSLKRNLKHLSQPWVHRHPFYLFTSLQFLLEYRLRQVMNQKLMRARNLLAQKLHFEKEAKSRLSTDLQIEVKWAPF